MDRDELLDFRITDIGYTKPAVMVPRDFTGRCINHFTTFHFINGKVVFKKQYIDHFEHLRFLQKAEEETGLSLTF